MTNALTNGWANPSSNNDLGHHAKFLVDQARTSIAKMLNANVTDIVFTSGGTEVLLFNVTNITLAIHNQLDIVSFYTGKQHGVVDCC